MTVWFTADTHFGHANIIKYCNRPFGSVEEMDHMLIRNWNSVVKKGDTVHHLGDFSLSKNALDIVPLLRGEIHLTAGNHDHCHPAHAKNEEKRKRMVDIYLNAGFASVELERELAQLAPPWTIALHHMPYTDDHYGEPRYLEYRPKDCDQWLLHGHVHNAWKINKRQINVGVDVWNFRPVSATEIFSLVREG